MDLTKILSQHNFFQQVRIMLRVLAKRQRISPKQALEDQFYFVSPLSLDAPNGAVGPIELTAGQPKKWQVEVAAYGLTGSLGALPTIYTEWLIERYYRYGDKTAKAFLDIFNHRLHSLRYLAWQKYHYYAMAESNVSLPLSEAICSLAGIEHGVSSLRQERFAELFAHSVRSMLNFETWIKYSLGVAVRVTPFTGRWRMMEPALCCCLGSPTQTLGDAPMLGSVYWDLQSHFTVTLGPVRMSEASLFLPRGKHYQNLWQHIRDYVGIGLDFDVDLLIENKHYAIVQLGRGQLGLDICLGESTRSGQHKIRLPVCREGK
ncbi:type VI secretion system baseplate subunit TssG (plasmid) [Hafnia alvei]|uniref:type VI secretion system baseplate subunit TssG n=1 Tax=Hafnia alvei TaxID=569 RepID=UPI000B65D959|nr:type VI secretion system baseplate subunit TssG [Hafnia alvei]MBI0278602.1 type VI secretion system baseplate subunit TssG [Hafnia alvei]PNL03897.1 type VI secretion system baseplate subunit TssG [Hafnia alvei]